MYPCLSLYIYISLQSDFWTMVVERCGWRLPVSRWIADALAALGTLVVLNRSCGAFQLASRVFEYVAFPPYLCIELDSRSTLSMLQTLCVCLIGACYSIKMLLSMLIECVANFYASFPLSLFAFALVITYAIHRAHFEARQRVGA